MVTEPGETGGVGAGIVVADVPPIPGFRFRVFEGPADAGALAEILNAESAADGIDEHVTAAEVAAELEHASEEDPRRTLVVAEMDGRVVAFARRSWRDRGVFVAYEHTGFVHPDVRRRGLGRALLRHQATALQALAAVHATEARAAATPDAPRAAAPADRVLFSWADTRRTGAMALLDAEGYVPVRWYLDLERPSLDDLPAGDLPPGIEMRAPDPAGESMLRAALAAEDEAFQDHWGHHAMTDEDADATLAEPDLDPSLWQIAWDGGEIAGVVRPIVYADENARFGRRRVWIDRVSVRRPWRGRGIARALLVAAMADARDRGLTSAALGVDSDNTTGALGLYERLGFERRSAIKACTKPIAMREERP
jgi:ribosomal protein S18 acetylase RimI-like enzyme